ncbi:hypothetical protein D9757_012901 [Collybiopsis confluens]|uniref:SEP domain-containing protein n=1 Tax=Collybiopsis confluens TaxID=2823264 RepID=A0A8H5DB19_9AGAR|nr:hypothetical protein D9757_014737 [Collybiopsis confluens]KAF5355612.1 hypothetical protein D9757_012901 [Collybiopsis confluens]
MSDNNSGGRSLGGDSSEPLPAGWNPDRPGAGTVPGGNIVRDLLRRAAEAGPPPVAESGSHKLGSNEVESAYVPDPNAPQSQEAATIRHITFWREGFTVEDGELMRYDDPVNQTILGEINAGRAPPSLLNVRLGELVELRVAKRTNESYVPPKRGALHGAGEKTTYAKE